MRKIKSITYIKLYHDFISKEFSIIDAILLEIIYFKSSDGYLDKSITYLEKITKFSRPTITRVFEKIEKMGLIEKVNNNCYYLTDKFDEFYNKRYQKTFLPNRFNKNMYATTSTYNHIYFDLMEELELSIIQYCFIDTCIGLFLTKGNAEEGYISKKYLTRKFLISDRYFYKIKRELLDKKYLHKDENSNNYILDKDVLRKFSESRDENKRKDDDI